MKYPIGTKVRVVSLPYSLIEEEAPIGSEGVVIGIGHNPEYKVESPNFKYRGKTETWRFHEENLEPVEEVIMEKLVNDTVNKPSHYTNSSIECIDAMKASLSPEEFKGFCKGNAFKYLWRTNHKNGLEDLKKAQWYLNKLITTIEEEGTL
jgi:hypothetical protein